jgi:hypothetical protein
MARQRLDVGELESEGRRPGAFELKAVPLGRVALVVYVFI